MSTFPQYRSNRQPTLVGPPPLNPTRGLVSFAEFEAPGVPTRGLISWAEMETANVNTGQTRRRNRHSTRKSRTGPLLEAPSELVVE